MEKKNKHILAWVSFASLMVAAVGCGQKMSGTYSLQTLSGGISSSCGNVVVPMNINENGSTISGTASTSCYTETLNGTINGDQVTGVTLTQTLVSQGYPPQQGTTPSSCTYVGNLNFANKQLSGTLNLQQPAQTQQQNCGPWNNYCGGGGYGSAICSPSINITGNMTN